MLKTCTKCDVEKPVEEFHRAPAGLHGRRGDCKRCVSARQQALARTIPAEVKRIRSKVPCKGCGGLKTRYSELCQQCARPGASLDDPKWRTNSQGYVVAMTPSGVEVRQHRVVMELTLGRPLQPHETVHHKNGQRDDNRIENLELWSHSQPCGQRVEDKLAWAHWFIKQYGE